MIAILGWLLLGALLGLGGAHTHRKVRRLEELVNLLNTRTISKAA